MHGFALVLVLAAAFMHATWNFLAKRTRGGAAVVWLYDVVSIIIYAPLALVILLQHLHFTLVQLALIFSSGCIHLVYFLLLQRGYRVGDLSVVYPLARGTGPLLSSITAILLFGERPALVAFLGILLVVVGIFLITGGTVMLSASRFHAGVLYGLLTGVCIATYTLVDKQAVSALLIAPVLLYYSDLMIHVGLLAPYAVYNWSEVSREWNRHRFEVIGIAILGPLSYFIILSVLVFTPVSYVAPMREVSVLIGTLMGTRFLAEGNTRRRLLAACVMVAGIIALAV